ncbi:hypothetical protein GCM10027047_35690 [Rhodococcus aerolatus]
MTFATTLVAILAGVGALLFNGVQLLRQVRADERNREVELEGVALTWKALDVPREPRSDSWSVAEHIFTLHNPSRLPITSICITVSAPCDIKRFHYDGSAEQVARELELTDHVLAGGETREWKRKIGVQWPDRDMMRNLGAEVTFYSLYYNEQRTTSWGTSRREGP